MEVYDPIDNSWNLLDVEMNEGRSYCGYAAIGGRIYVAGGYDAWTYNNLSHCEVYEPMNNSWNSIAPIPSAPTEAGARCMMGSVALGGKLYIFGGGLLGGLPSPPMLPSNLPPQLYDSNAAWKRQYIFSYDVQTDVWTPIAPWISLPPALSTDSYAGISAIASGGRIYTAGGFNNSTIYLNPPTGYPYPPIIFDPSLAPMPQITHQGEDFYISHQRGGPKTFVIPHPEPEHEGKMLRHACVEAPTRGTNMYEYQIEVKEDNATTKIKLPSYFKHLNSRPRILYYTQECDVWILWRCK